MSDGPLKSAAASSSRLVASLLRLAVGVAVKCRMPMKQLTKLVQVTYYMELKKRSGKSLQEIADLLGVSLRTVGVLSAASKKEMYAPEKQVEPMRRINALLQRGPMSRDELVDHLEDLEEEEIDRALHFLQSLEWVQQRGARFQLAEVLRSFVDEDVTRRMDALNHQMDVTAAGVWTGFMLGNHDAKARTWSLSAIPEDFSAFAEKAVSYLRHSAVDLEEAATENPGQAKRYGITLMIAPIEDSPRKKK